MRYPGTIGVLVVAALSSAETMAPGPARVVKDINVAAGAESHGWPQGFVDLDDLTLFFATTRTTGFELWRTDGTPAGTILVKDINPGVPSSVNGNAFPVSSDLVVARVGDVAFFPASDGVHGIELWRSDGSEAGTFLLADIRPGFASGLDPFFLRRPLDFGVSGDLFYFLAADETHGLELWRTDGTVAGTRMVKDINPGGGHAVGTFDRLECVAMGEMLVFVAYDGIHGRQLWRTDGTEAGTIRLTDLSQVGISRLAGDVGGVLLFAASATLGDLELWRSDGTEDGTFLVEDIRPGPAGSDPFGALVANGELYFTADDGEHGRELWKSDGTSGGTVLLKDVRLGAADSSPTVHAAFDGRVYFIANDGLHGRELWITDGSEGTHLVADIVPGPNGSSEHGGFTRAGGTLYFVVNDAVHGPEVWTTDGTEGGTREVTNLFATFGPHDLNAVGGRLFFVRGDSVHGVEPWSTNGADGGTLLGDINAGPSNSYSFTRPGRRGDLLLFGADDGIHGAELWVTDGTPAGTRLLEDVNRFQRSAPSIQTLVGVNLGDELLFVANDTLHGREPWMTDGTSDGTHLVKDIHPGLNGALENENGTSFADLGDRTVFGAADGPHGPDLWVSDGTEAGTHLVKRVSPSTGFAKSLQFATLDSLAVFLADDGDDDTELWATDGSEAGTHLVTTIPRGPAGSTSARFVRFGSVLVFFANAGTATPSLWRTDGTAAGTYRLVGPEPGYPSTPVELRGALWLTYGSDLWRTDGTVAGTERVAELDVIEAYDLTVAGDRLFFGGYTDAAGAELWVSDGTSAGTHLVKDAYPGEDGVVSELTAVGDVVFFPAIDPEHGLELWKSDGTEAGTVLVRDIDPSDWADPGNLMEVEGVLLFSATDADHGRELWRSDGTEAGTFLVQDLLPGPESSSPGPFVSFGTRIAFAATDDALGREPWIGRPSILTRQPARAIRDLADQVRALGLPRGIEASLTAKLNAAAAALARPNGSRVALRLLGAFAAEVGRTSPPIAAVAAADLLDFVSEIQQLLGVDNGSAPAVPPARLLEERGAVLNRPR
ncbi:MAG TPA: ELWxxDGT repeat protein [Candidatus Polarisedimenticolaceae bacterium]|nr:ELWxxDGT repeat protein [Candidatus Polarisedimenticolaceae bacterium]